MLTNIDSRGNLRAFSRAKAKDFVTKSINYSKLDVFLSQGWSIVKKNKSTVQIKRKKSHSELLEDRVWILLYKMGFQFLSLEGGSELINSKDLNSSISRIDIVGVDNEVALAIKCISSEKRVVHTNFKEELEKQANIRERFSQAINKQFRANHKIQTAIVTFTSNINLSEVDLSKAQEANVVIFNETDLEYYEKLVSHIGEAAKYQFFADIIPGKRIPGLEIKVPAIKTRMGGTSCYTFSISPEYLLKISYISHRAKGKASDVNTYQRMVGKSRLSKIRKYILENGIFPTNIVLNLDERFVQFDRIGQSINDKHDSDYGVLGWLTIRPSYKSAWIIDGQHRLYAYSGLEKAKKSKLSILAFEGLTPSSQAQLFVDINAKQKSVKQSLLQELYAELHWDASDPEVRVRAIISKAIQTLGNDPDSPLYNRIISADSKRDHLRCITLTSLFSVLTKTGFFASRARQGAEFEYGPLWAGPNELTLKRTIYVLKNWLNVIRNSASEWWDKGSAEGGGLAMNDGVSTCLEVLRSVFAHLESAGVTLVRLQDNELFEMIEPYAVALGKYFSNFTEDEKKRFRDLRGVQGQTIRTKRCQLAIRNEIPEFNPQGLDEFIEQEKAQTNTRAKEITDWIETTMQRIILEELKQEYGDQENEWWTNGVPKNVRLKVAERQEQDDNRYGGKEAYFDLMDYRKIIIENWNIFEPIFGYGKSGNKEKRTSWLVFVNQKRNIVAHPSTARNITLEDLSELEKYKEWLESKIQESVYDVEAEEEDED